MLIIVSLLLSTVSPVLATSPRKNVPAEREPASTLPWLPMVVSPLRVAAAAEPAAVASSPMVELQELVQEQEPEPEPGPSIDIANIPLYFVANQGQLNQDVHMHGKGAGGAGLFFTRKEVVLVLPPPSESEAEPLPDADFEQPPEPPEPTEPAQVLRMRFKQANSQPLIEAAEPLATQINYLLGDDPQAWHTGLSTYGAVVYRDLYEGIDLRYEGQGSHLKGTWLVAAGADPTDILWQYVGAKDVEVDESTGNLLITMAKPTGHDDDGPEREPVMEMAPVAWQEIDGEQVAVDVQFDVANSGQVGFSLGNYDPSHSLIIDPTLDFSTYLGGSGSDYGQSIAVDAAGNAYVTGYTNSSDFPSNNGTVSASNYDVFVSKLEFDSANVTLAYTTLLGGSSSDYGYDIAVGGTMGDERVYVTGYTYSTNYPMVNAYDTTTSGMETLLTSLSTDGQTTYYSTYVGGSSNDYGRAVAVDTAGNAYVSGYTYSSDIPNSLNAWTAGYDVFVAKFNGSGGNDYNRYIGGSGSDYGYGIAVGAEAVFLTGYTNSTTGLASTGAYDEVLGGGYDTFVASIDSNTGAVNYSTYLGGTGYYDYGYGIAADADNNAYVVGYTSGGIEGFSNCTSCVGGGHDAFVAKLNAEGTALTYGTYVGGTSTDVGMDIAIDGVGNAYITGYTYSANDFPTAGEVYQAQNAGSADAFVTMLDTGGKDLVYSSYLGGASYDYGYGIAVSVGAISMAGRTNSTLFPTLGEIQGDQGGTDAFVARFLDGITEPDPVIFGQGLQSITGAVYGFDPGADIRGAVTNLYSGSFGYTYPIPLPPGRGGLTPALGLSYNRSRDNRATGHYSTVGIGWSLMGENYISRSPRSYGVGQTGAHVIYNLVLNGATYTIRRAFDGEDSAGDLFVKENPFIKIRASGSGGNDGFEVTTPDGIVYEFKGKYEGITKDQLRNGAPFMEYRWENTSKGNDGGSCSSGDVQWIKLPLMQVQDANGNTIDYTWQPVTTNDEGVHGGSDNIADPSNSATQKKSHTTRG